jgi:hypothetical protein
MQFVEPTCRPYRGPQAGEAGAENDDVFHGLTLPLHHQAAGLVHGYPTPAVGT